MLQSNNFKCLTKNVKVSNVAKEIFISDMTSYIMGNAQSSDILITINRNKNIVAVASLIGISYIIFPDGICPDQEWLEIAEQEGILVYMTHLSSARAAQELYEILSI